MVRKTSKRTPDAFDEEVGLDDLPEVLADVRKALRSVTKSPDDEEKMKQWLEGTIRRLAPEYFKRWKKAWKERTGG